MPAAYALARRRVPNSWLVSTPTQRNRAGLAVTHSAKKSAPTPLGMYCKHHANVPLAVTSKTVPEIAAPRQSRNVGGAAIATTGSRRASARS